MHGERKRDGKREGEGGREVMPVSICQAEIHWQRIKAPSKKKFIIPSMTLAFSRDARLYLVFSVEANWSLPAPRRL